MLRSKDSKIIIIGAGVFGLSTGLQLAQDGYTNITILDRSLPPVPDGSSVDISRIIRFDYSDPVYAKMAKEAYDLWISKPEYTGSFNSTPFLLVSSNKEDNDSSYLKKSMGTLKNMGMPIHPLHDAEDARRHFPIISGLENMPDFEGYYNENAGWADATKAITRLKDDCIVAGVSIIGGPAGHICGWNFAEDGTVTNVRTKTGTLDADLFILATGAWSDNLIDMNANVLATAQCIGYLSLSDGEMQRYKDLPIYINFDSGYFCFPPHQETRYLKMAVHGLGYTNARESEVDGRKISSPESRPARERRNFVPDDARERLHAGLKTVLPELGEREFDKAYVCWYTDTLSSDFIMDYHPHHRNMFIATAGSGHAFKFLPVLGKYVSGCLHRTLEPALLEKWHFSSEKDGGFVQFEGDGSRGGPKRREITSSEKEALFGDPSDSCKL